MPLNNEHPSEQERVNHPSHYQSENGIEAIDAIVAALGKEGAKFFCMGNTIKYLFRAGKKDISPLAEDLKKAKWYLDYAITLQTQLDEPPKDNNQ